MNEISLTGTAGVPHRYCIPLQVLRVCLMGTEDTSNMVVKLIHLLRLINEVVFNNLHHSSKGTQG